MKCCDITIGMLKRRVTFQRANKVRRDGGGYDYDWADLLTAWAKITPKTGTEKTHAGKLQATNYVIVIMRYTNVLQADDRMQYNGNDYQIRSIINIEEQNQWLELKLEQGVVT